MRQVADRPTIRLLAHNLGKMERLRDQLDELFELQKNGVKDLKGLFLYIIRKCFKIYFINLLYFFCIRVKNSIKIDKT